jgi:3-deoxy-7-phosphoheptulonate synthase
MIVVMQPNATPEHVEHVVELVRQMGLKDHVIDGTNRTVIACIGDKRRVDKTAIETAPFVEKVVPILSPYKVASKEVKQEPSQVRIGKSDACVGGKRLSVMAGPCSVEDRAQMLEAAHAMKEAGAMALRGGAYKPRTNPYSFQGLGERGLEILADAGRATGLAVVTEVMSIEQVATVSRYADVLQIGTRNMHNFNLLQAVGAANKPVLLKRGWSATLEEFLLAAEYIIDAGNPNVILCERGIRTSETHVRNTLALATVPAVKRESHLPIIVDPSHGTGYAYLVPAMAKAAVAAGADGLMIEVHPDPEHALTDGAQSINIPTFQQLMKDLARVAEAVDRTI